VGKIFCLIGKSSTGKDTILKALLADREFLLTPVVPYTTRPQREQEIDGVEYFFIDEARLEAYERAGAVFEKRVYHTVNGDWAYCTVDDGRIDLAKGHYILIGTLEAYKNLQRCFGAGNVIPFYIELDDGPRLERALAREKRQPRPNYDELCRRFIADSVDFSPANLAACGITRHYCNDDLERCLLEIKKDLRRFTGGGQGRG
jgi:guanylate kinase